MSVIYTHKQGGGKSRIEFIDLAKGICITLVVFIHCCSLETSSNLDISLKTLRMPLYFILSGLFFSNYGSISNLSIKKVNKMIIPFIFFMIISYLFSYMTDMIAGREITYRITDNITFSNAWWSDPWWPNIAIWFLLCLFWDNIIFGMVSIYSPNKAFEISYMMMLTVIGIFFSISGTNTPLYIGSALISLPFFYMGSILRKTMIITGSITRKELIMSVLFVTIMFAAPYIHKAYIDFRTARIVGNILFAYIIPVFSVIGVLLICKWIITLPYFSFIGRYSIVILGLHWPVLQFLNCISPDLGIYHRYIMFVILMIVIPAIIIPIVRLFPYFTAQKDLISIKGSFSKQYPDVVKDQK